MKILVFVLTLSVAGLATQQHAPISADEVTLRHRIYGDARITIFLLDIPPGQATLLRPSQTRSRRAMFVSDPRLHQSTENIGTDHSLWLPVQEERDGRRAQLGGNVDEKSPIGAAK